MCVAIWFMVCVYIYVNIYIYILLGWLVQGEKKKWLADTLVGLIQVCVAFVGLWGVCVCRGVGMWMAVGLVCLRWGERS